MFLLQVVDDRADQLEGESFQPAYTPYSPPPAAYDSAYVPVEQKSIEAAVAAGAAAYPGVSFSRFLGLQQHIIYSFSLEFKSTFN